MNERALEVNVSKGLSCLIFSGPNIPEPGQREDPKTAVSGGRAALGGRTGSCVSEGRGDAEPKKLLNTPHAARPTRSDCHPRKSRMVSNKF